jgi:hypothetical protein
MAMDATCLDAGAANAASTVDDGRAVCCNTLPGHMDAYSAARGQHSQPQLTPKAAARKF